jgi:hypothetical protein
VACYEISGKSASKGREGLRRLVVCQGSTQLLAALAALTQRGATPSESALVVCGLYVAREEEEAFAETITRLAESAGPWKKILRLGAADVERWTVASGQASKAESVLSEIRARIGWDGTDEIYLSRNWLGANQLLLSAFGTAKKICYGDGMGFFFSEDYGRSVGVAPGFRKSLSRLRRKLGLAPRKREGLDRVDFDRGCFVFPQAFGSRPDMVSSLVDKAVAWDVVERLSASAPSFPDALTEPVVLLTENFSESRMMDPDREIAAYERFVRGLALSPLRPLFIKPHPRDDTRKLRAIREALLPYFASAELWEDAGARYAPFELMLARSGREDVTVLSFGATSLSLSYLFARRPVLGFGEAIVRGFFRPEHQARRLLWESDLATAVERLSPVAASV